MDDILSADPRELCLQGSISDDDYDSDDINEDDEVYENNVDISAGDNYKEEQDETLRLEDSIDESRSSEEELSDPLIINEKLENVSIVGKEVFDNSFKQQSSNSIFDNVELKPILPRGRGLCTQNFTNEGPKMPYTVTYKDTPGQYPEFAKIPYLKKRRVYDLSVPQHKQQLDPTLIDFSVKTAKFSIIIDKDDADEAGWLHACRLLEENHIQFDKTHIQRDLWHFGLISYPVTLSIVTQFDLIKLEAREINEINRPYWIMFKTRPIFNDKSLNTIPTTISESDIKQQKSFIRFMFPVQVQIYYGALTAMNRFFYHEDHVYPKYSYHPSLVFYDNKFQIEYVQIKREQHDKKRIQIKKSITTDILDRSVIIQLFHNGFAIYLCMKGNVHEAQRNVISNDKSTSTLDNQQDKKYLNYKRVSGEMSFFSTIRLLFRLRNDDIIAENLKRYPQESKTFDEYKFENLEQIRLCFNKFLDFFYKNSIYVCFGSIASRLANNITSLTSHRFQTFIQTYSWLILINIGFRFEQQIRLSKIFIQTMKNIANDQTFKYDLDDRFYRICLYLWRRSSEYFFLDIDRELEIGLSEYKLKREQQNYVNNLIDPPKKGYAYIPSVIITPTTIRITPLKLCKLNRIIREKMFGGEMNFVLVEIRDEASKILYSNEYRDLRQQFEYYLNDGFQMTDERRYKYLHHSQSQLKQKQYWFYYHDKSKGYLSIEDAYVWMGDFDKERVVAKHAARIAQCFTSTESTISISADLVNYIRDIESEDKKYTFTDGVGTISTKLRNEIQEYMGKNYPSSVLQIRYGGCKGTLSVDPRLDNQQHQLVIRDSMNKFITDHDILEVCKLSSPRALYLNRQDIVLLSSRQISDANFLILQNENHLWLIQALLTSAAAYELLNEKILRVFSLKSLAWNMNLVEEQFFLKLIIRTSYNCIQELLKRTRIRIAKEKARNMFGIVDEYAVLKYGQVFIQYTHMRTDKLDEQQNKNNNNGTEVLTGKVVITKNPCHHPGDLRTFEAIDCPQLKHLKDVVVFPQTGPRPHSNEISGSDLDGDEYVIIWHEDLLPNTENDDAYDYDSQEKPIKLDHPVTRSDINEVVLNVSEQDCMGTLSNIHLAYVDKLGVKDPLCMKLAGYISQEVDASKTGKHPLTEDEIRDYRLGLNNKLPDFMFKKRGEQYESPNVLGKLFRSVRRAQPGWIRAIQNSGNFHQNNDDIVTDNQSQSSSTMILDKIFYYDKYKQYRSQAEKLYHSYKQDLLEIISVYHLQDETDLFCRCESMGNGRRSGGIEDSASIELLQLIDRIKQEFNQEFDHRSCCKRYQKIKRNCNACYEEKLSKSSACYVACYKQANGLPAKSKYRILSFPWLFADLLMDIRRINRKNQNLPVEHKFIVIGRAMFNALMVILENKQLKLKIYIPMNKENDLTLYLTETNSVPISQMFNNNKKKCIELNDIDILKVCFVEILHDWLVKQNLFGNVSLNTDKKPLIPEQLWHELLIRFLVQDNNQYYGQNYQIIFSSNELMSKRYYTLVENICHKEWTDNEYNKMDKMFNKLLHIAFKYSKQYKSDNMAFLSEYLILALQSIGIEKNLTNIFSK